MLRRNRLLPEALAVAAAIALLVTTRTVAAAAVCVPAGGWAVPGDASARPIGAEQVFADLARRRVVLLGETHDDPDHHRWQLQTVAGLYALHPKLVLALEMFPHRHQSVLDQWVAGELSPAQFLERSEWRKVWGQDSELYLPIFQFARMNRVPMLALNVDRRLTREVGEKGWAQVPSSEREGVSDPAPAGPEYLRVLWQSFREHARDGQPTPVEAPELEDPAFRRFVDNMLLWDRTMAQTIAERVNRDEGTLVVGLVGSGHLREGFGVARQLADLGVSNCAVLLPWDTTAVCDRVTPRLADVLFGVEPRAETAENERPRLGIMLEQGEGGVRVQKVLDGSIAQAAGLREDDVIERIAGRRVADAGDVIGAVQGQAPGTWLPIIVRRGAQTMEVIARFPPHAPR